MGHDSVESKYTKSQILDILNSTDFAYHRVDLPFGLHTPGRDRSTTRDLILPDNLQGKTVLDVGCALGYFCFEAEARGAKSVVGIELKELRYKQALTLKGIRGSNVQFILGDVFEKHEDEKYDVVLALNVIHHMVEPMRLLHHLASLTSDRLIIEFPTFNDNKFKDKNRAHFHWLLNYLNVIGVHPVEHKASQSFVFSPGAMKRLLTNHIQLFSEVKIISSPIAGRKIAICYK